MKVLVRAGVSSKTVTKKDTGEVFDIHTQRAKLLFGGDGFDDIPFDLSLNSPRDEYAAGEYTFGPGTFVTNQYNSLAFGYDMVLVPVTAGSK